MPIKSLMIEFFRLILRLAGKIDTKFPKGLRIGLRKNYCGMGFAVAELIQSLHSALGCLTLYCGNRKSYQYLIYMKTGIVVTEKLGLQLLDRL